MADDEKYSALLRGTVQKIRENHGNLGLDIDMPVVATDKETLHKDYCKILAEVSALHTDYAERQASFASRLETLNDKVIAEDTRAEELRQEYQQYQRAVCRKAINPRTQKPVPMKWILEREAETDELNKELETHRLKNIHYSRQLDKLRGNSGVSAPVKKRRKKDSGAEEAETVHFIDFEQLKIENQTLNEKIEDRNEEIIRLKKKINTTVHLLAHFKEKLFFVLEDNSALREECTAVDSRVNAKKEELTALKKKREKIRSKNEKLRQREQFVGNQRLVDDFHRQKSDAKRIKGEIEEIMNKCGMMRETIDQCERLKETILSNI